MERSTSSSIASSSDDRCAIGPFDDVGRCCFGPTGRVRHRHDNGGVGVVVHGTAMAGQNVDMSVHGELRYLLIPGGGGSGPDHHLHLGSDALLDTWPEGRIYLRELVGRARSFNQHVDSL